MHPQSMFGCPGFSYSDLRIASGKGAALLSQGQKIPANLLRSSIRQGGARAKFS